MISHLKEHVLDHMPYRLRRFFPRYYWTPESLEASFQRAHDRLERLKSASKETG